MQKTESKSIWLPIYYIVSKPKENSGEQKRVRQGTEVMYAEYIIRNNF